MKVAALKDMNIHNTDFDNMNDGFLNDNYSDFDIEDFVKSSQLGSVDTVIKSPKRNRPKF